MRVRFTREGLRFVILLGVVAFAAYNTRNNLIFLMLSVGLASLAVDLAGGWLSIRRMSVETGEVEEAYAGTPFTQPLRLRNLSSWLHGFGLTVAGGESQLPFLPRGGAASLTVTRRVPRRGLHRMPASVLSTSFPLGVFRFERRFESRHRVLVFPETRSIDPAVLSWAGGVWAGTGGRPGGGEEFFRLRGYEAGDPVHHIHWRTTAKVGELTVRELGDAQEDELTLAFQPFFGGNGSPASFERLVTTAASIARHLEGVGRSYRFIAPGVEIPLGLGREHLRAVLSHLALAEPSPAAGATWGARLGRARELGERVVLVGPEGETASAGIGGSLRVVTPERALRASEERA